jgi:exo-beta-1,3-glucanase (GH17 family)
MQFVRFIIIALVMTACSSENKETMSPIIVEIVTTDAGYELMRGGEPYVIKGAGMSTDDLERFAAHGGNSIRNWSTTGEFQDVMALLDEAHANGVTVALCLPMIAERHGFDYNDSDAVAKQLDMFREDVLKFRDHPALLAWIIGNELNHSYTNPAVYDAVNDVARMIHELDPNHPTTSTISEYAESLIGEIMARAPDLDFISFQAYGALFGLADALNEMGFERPFMVTEWGAIGYWEMEQTSWGVAIEMTSSEKAAVFERGYREVLTPLDKQLIGSYVFYWGQKQERTPTWFGMFMEAGEETEVVDVMHYFWNDSTWPANRVPRVNALLLDGKSAKDSVIVEAGGDYEVVFDVSDHEDDPLRYHWELKPESDATQAGGDFEASVANIEGSILDSTAPATTITAPAPGNYRLFAYVYDDHGHAAHANIPFQVNDNFVQKPEALLNGEVMAIAYSGFREGQHPDRGDGANNPSNDEILEDLEILLEHGFNLIRLYDSGENSAATLALIREHDLPMKVLLGMWLRAEYSNHEGCPWLDEPIPAEVLVANTLDNAAEIRRGIKLAQQFDDIVVAVNVGNEALVDWNDHMVPLEKVITYVRQVKASIDQQVTVADNYEWWIRDGAPLAAEVDFLGVHTYPVWENRPIDEGLDYTLENIERVHEALPDKPIAILEAGWATTATEFAERANEPDQTRYFHELRDWATTSKTTTFFFEAFDEPWKGSANDPHGAEKHWGLFKVDRTAKEAAASLRKEGDDE